MTPDVRARVTRSPSLEAFAEQIENFPVPYFPLQHLPENFVVDQVKERDQVKVSDDIMAFEVSSSNRLVEASVALFPGPIEEAASAASQLGTKCLCAVAVSKGSRKFICDVVCDRLIQNLIVQGEKRDWPQDSARFRIVDGRGSRG